LLKKALEIIQESLVDRPKTQNKIDIKESLVDRPKAQNKIDIKESLIDRPKAQNRIAATSASVTYTRKR
jgi:hypothetical protein